ncbi:phenylacetate--CoA ligase family protein [Hamadaea tsunoensis]|uniref:phenylacetate--CoA ligase family protein n=1 Tax=Hamadaea tsunoensis TaxID=53368 RepID=UPI00040810F7|nr:AMP-binding protein [Hamadaea tsunoensis]
MPERAAVEERIRVYRGEMIFQAHLFPEIYARYQEYRRRDETAASLRELQTGRLRAMLTHVAAAVPAYRGRVGDPGDPWAALAALPTVAKADLRAGFADHCDDGIDPDRCRSVQTSGTTGEPLRIVHDFEHLAHAYALGMVRTHDHGLPLDRRVLYPFHSALDRWFEYTAPAYGLSRIAEFGAVGDEAYWVDVVDRVRGYRPQAIVGHATRCLELADLLTAHGGRGFPAPGIVSTWGERLTPAAAERLAAFFEAPVRDSYGMGEVGTIAAQCARGAYHIEGERLWVEVLDEAGAPVPGGGIGEIVVTNLINRAQPLLRYRTGDLGALSAEPCACGRPHRALRLVAGREPGRLRLAGGILLGVRALALPLLAVPLARYQIIQRRPDLVELIVAPLPQTTAAALEKARDQAAAAVHALDPGVRVELRADGAFVRRGARKMEEFISLVDDSLVDEPEGASG